MCTASWHIQEDGYDFFFNRDEQRSRPKAELPALDNISGVKVLRPLDPKGGGTWIAVNEHGLTLSLLNNYSADAKRKAPATAKSRGELPLILSSSANNEEWIQHLEKMDLSVYRPFFLLGVDRTGSVAGYSWNGSISLGLQALDLSEGVISTSSFKSEEVQEYRKTFFKEKVGARSLESREVAANAHLAYHRSTNHPDAAFNPLMSRDDAMTHCLSQVSISSGEVAFRYWERDEKTENLIDCSLFRPFS